MVEFRLLGTLSLVTADGREAGSLLTQPRRLALLAYLAAATPQGPHRRDTLLALFWPELDQEHARAALRQSLHVLRSALGANAMLSRGDEEIGLDFERIWCDVAAFARAIDGGQTEQALDLYRGNLLEGFFISDAPEFERWLESERARLSGVAARTARTLAESCERRGDLSTAVQWARRAIGLAPNDEGLLRQLIAVLDRNGDRAGALQAYEQFAQYLAEEYEAEPAAETKALLAAVRARETAAPVTLTTPSLADPTPLAVAAPSPRGRRGAIAAVVPLAALVLLIAGRWLWDRTAGGRAELMTTDRRRLAVLPLKNIGTDARDAYVAEGITDELIATLSQISGLRVLAGGAVQRYAAPSVSSADIARHLGVGTLLEGTVGRQGERLRVHLELIDSRTQENLWSHTYDERLQDARTVQREVARSVADKLQVPLLATEQAQLGRRTTPNATAYDLYLRGLYESHRESRAATDSAIALLERATTADPQFAASYSALAYAYTEKLFDYDSDRRWEERAYVAIQKTLALDPDLADAYLARGKLTWTLANHFPHARAIQDMKRALALNPNLATAHYWLGAVYMHIGLLDKALQELRLAVNLDPSVPEAPPRIARVHWYEQRFDTALVEFERMPGWEDEHALVLDHLGRTDEALRLLQQAEGRGPREPADIASARAVILARRGERARVTQQIAVAVARGSGRSHFHHAEYNIATAYALQGDHARALAWLRQTAEDGLPCYPLFAGDPYLDSLRRDPQFVAFLARLKAQWENYKATL
ncbi:MAG TPA: BTAD domain-containing putative transcriptional regulator [Gemmatimonadales bacterium]|nr:BTAD domain-containing putative transcriptional regulator [Gemmatimonadales bacterium]